ncbi:hypothetical protein MMC27_007333 [Xylographa pallens]|nr:hypothetical protein [Xylographa pallens]
MDEHSELDIESRYMLDDGTPFQIGLSGPNNEEQTESCRERNERFYTAVLSWAEDRPGINASLGKNTSLMKDAEVTSSAMRAVLQYPALHLGFDRENKARILTKYWHRSLVKNTEIRLFHITGIADINGCNYLTCEIVHADLDDKPTYHAVSYVWGSLDVNYPIIINGTQCLLITKSLQDFLEEAFSSPEKVKGVMIWADQLSIDQYNPEERSQQVLLMRRVFQQSGLTYLWLGKADEDTAYLSSLLASIEASSLKYDTAVKACNQPSVKEAVSILASDPATGHIPPGRYPGWMAAARIVYRPWFSRMWVFQEAVAAPVSYFVCGKYAFRLNTLVSALILLPTMWSNVILPSFDSYASIGAMTIQHSMVHGPKDRYDGYRQDLLQLLSNTRTFECSDPRDRVYAALSLQSKNNHIMVPIDYSRSVSEIYTDTAKRIILGQRNLHTLEYITEERDLDSLASPSWVPNWMDKVYNSKCPLEADLVKQRKFNAGGCPSFTPEFADCGLVLLAKGRIIDTVESLASDSFYIGGRHGATAQFLGKELLFQSLLETVEKRLLMDTPALQQTERAQLIVVRTLTADGTRILPTPTISRFDDCHASALADMLRASEPPSEQALDAFRNLSPLLYICRGRVIATLRNRYICLAPMMAWKDDVIGLLQGSSLPWILRPQAKNGQYKVVGACYVDGIMYNEEEDTTETLSNTIELI